MSIVMNLWLSVGGMPGGWVGYVVENGGVVQFCWQGRLSLSVVSSCWMLSREDMKWSERGGGYW